MDTRRTTSFLFVVCLTASLVIAGCSTDGPEPPPAPGTQAESRGIDTREFYDGYEEAVEEDMAVAANGSVAVPTSPSGGAPAAEDGAGGPPALPDPDEDNTFVDAGASGFVATADDARSTFALDVDTGSFGVARTLLRDGYRVPPASVRVEEWVNSLPYGDPVPSDADLGVVSETGLAPSLDDGTQVVRIGVAAREVAPATRPRVNVTLVVDRSGSMDIRERLGLVQSSLALLADRLRDDDTVSVVSFEDQAKPILDPTPVSETATILDAVRKLEPGGSTNLEAGLALGYEQARDAFDPEAVNLVVLCSDGVANVGATGPGSIVERIQQEGAEGIHLVTVGFGMGNYNDHLMEQLADLGDGFYSYVDTYDEAERLFGSDLTTTLVPVASEARAQVAFDPDAVEAYRLIGYDNRDLADEDFTDLGVDAGELGSGHHATALYEVRLADGVQPGASIGTASVRWRSLATGDAEQADVDVVAAGDAEPSDTLALATAAADLAQWVKGADGFAGRGVTRADLEARVASLVDRDVDGADQLAEVISLLGRQ